MTLESKYQSKKFVKSVFYVTISFQFCVCKHGETLAFENWDENEPKNSGGEERCVNFF